ncbi:MAG: nucleotidyltransferase family protein [Sedimenticola sp.]|nr:nucleotidyltransferase family protein [Sedimenticola sp.]
MTFDKELELLVRLARKDPTRSRQTEVDLQTIDWEHFIQLALDHQLTPLIFAVLEENYLDLVPPELVSAFEFYVESVRDQNRRLLTALVEIGRAMERVGIEIMPFKGPLLGGLAYGDTTLRISRDLDILLPEERLKQAMDVLFSLGYRLPNGTTAIEYDAIRRYGGQYIIYGGDPELAVEPHWALTPSTVSYELNYGAIWDRSISKLTHGITVQSPSPEDYFLILCIHGAKEHWPSLKSVVDLAYYIDEHPDANWRLSTELAADQGCLRVVRTGLELIAHCGLIDLPEVLKHQIGVDRTAFWLAKKAMTRFSEETIVAPNIYALSYYQYRQRERIQDRLRYILRTLTTPLAKHYVWVRLPSSLIWLYPGVKVIHDYLALPLWLLHKRMRRIFRATLINSGNRIP